MKRWQICTPSCQSTPPPSSRGCLPAAPCREPASRSGSARDDQADEGFQPPLWPYDLRPTTAGGDTPCRDPWWARSELKGKFVLLVKISPKTQSVRFQRWWTWLTFQQLGSGLWLWINMANGGHRRTCEWSSNCKSNQWLNTLMAVRTTAAFWFIVFLPRATGGGQGAGGAVALRKEEINQ